MGRLNIHTAFSVVKYDSKCQWVHGRLLRRGQNTAIYEGYDVAVGKFKAAKHRGPLSRQPDIAQVKHCTKKKAEI